MGGGQGNGRRHAQKVCNTNRGQLRSRLQSLTYFSEIFRCKATCSSLPTTSIKDGQPQMLDMDTNGYGHNPNEPTNREDIDRSNRRIH